MPNCTEIYDHLNLFHTGIGILEKKLKVVYGSALLGN